MGILAHQPPILTPPTDTMLKFISTFLWVTVAAASTAALGLMGIYLYLSPSLPSIETLRDSHLQTPLRVYTSDNKLIGEFGEKRRLPIKYSDIPHTYIEALLAAEDDQFFAHNGVSLKGLLRASTQLVRAGDIRSGGSTITMQVARNFFLSNKQTFKRKFNEILLALRIEQALSKQDILELYVNVIFLGNRAYGIQAASQVYFGKPLDTLSLAELATLAALPKAPSTLNPVANPARAKERRDWILGRLFELGKIDAATRAAAEAEPIVAQLHGANIEFDAPEVAEMARKEAVNLFGNKAYTEGYRVYTTIDSRLQGFAQNAVLNGLFDYDSRHGYRGPEQTFAAKNATAAQKLAAPDNTTLQRWLDALAKIPTLANLKPAVVTLVGDTKIKARLADGTEFTLGWDQGLAKAAPYVSEDSIGPAPKWAKDVVKTGDVIRVRQQEAHWELAQLPNVQAALVVLDANNGAVVAVVGGLDFAQSHFNRATQAKRLAGSNFKPFFYTAALELGYSPASIINDAPIVLDTGNPDEPWRPENAGGKFMGPITLRKALYLSRNLVSVRLLQSIGLDNALDGLDRFGINKNKVPHNLTIALGTHAMTPLEVARGYTLFANGGYKVEPYFISQVYDANNELLYAPARATVCYSCTEGAPKDPLKPAAPRVVDEQTSFIMDSILKDVVRKGTATAAKKLNRSDIAGKTGTTNGPTDVWFSGYGGGLTATAWIGFDNNTLLGRKEFGGTAALPIWIHFMQEALADRPEVLHPQPSGLVTIKINPDTGARAEPGEPDAVFEYFRSGQNPDREAASNAVNSEAETSELPQPNAPKAVPEDLF